MFCCHANSLFYVYILLNCIYTFEVELQLTPFVVNERESSAVGGAAI